MFVFVFLARAWVARCVVHGCCLCFFSAGVGRTGTYIAIDYLLDRAKAEKKVNLYTLTKAMRENRVNMIQVAPRALVYFVIFCVIK